MADNRLYLVDPQDGTATAVFDFDDFDIPAAHAMPQLFRLNRQGTRLFVSLNYGGHAGKIVMLDVTRPDQPKLLDVVDLGPGSGPHFLRLTSDERRLVVSDYFLVEDLTPGGVVIDVRENEMELDPRFDLDFDRDIATGPARPHGMVLLTARAGQKPE
jgi:selenium-binding protein 1